MADEKIPEIDFRALPDSVSENYKVRIVDGSAPGELILPDAKETLIENPVYVCPKHGETADTIISNVPGHEGAWCQICWLESLDAIGVSRMTKVVK